MRIWTRKSASIQPRTSLGKSDVSWQENFDQQALATEQSLDRETSTAGRPPSFGDVDGVGSQSGGNFSKNLSKFR